MSLDSLAGHIAAHTRRRYVRLVGRGTTALYVALRAIALTAGPGSVLVPDIICSTVLDAVLLAGFRPAFADVSADRFAPDAESLRRATQPDTRAVIAAHIFGLTAPLPDVGLPVIEDAVQGLGGVVSGRPIGAGGSGAAISVIGFHPTKMIPGVGGAILTDDPALWRVIQAVRLEEDIPAYREGRYAGYWPQLRAMRPALIRPFDDSLANVTAIRDGWDRLGEQVAGRNQKAGYVRAALAAHPALGLNLPILRPGDAVWRYPFTAPTRAAAMRIQRRLQGAGLPGSRPYPSLSAIFDPQPGFHGPDLAARMVNLWVDPDTSYAQLDAMIGRILA